MEMRTSWLGVPLEHPFLAGASPLADTVEGACRLEEAGASAIVLRSLFEEQIAQGPYVPGTDLGPGGDFWSHTGAACPDEDDFRIRPEEYLDHLGALREHLSVPVIASLSGTSTGEWVEHARLCEQAGAAALELSLYDVPTDPEESALDVESRAVELVRAVRDRISIPFAVKLSPFHTAPVHFATALQRAGAEGLVLFHRLLEPDVAVDEPRLDSRIGLSEPSELRLRLRWLAVLSGMTRLDLAASGGVHDAPGAVKALLCGARVVEMVSALLLRGPEEIRRVRDGVAAWGERAGFDSLADFRGAMDVSRGPDERAWGRANYVRLLQTWSR